MKNQIKYISTKRHYQHHHSWQVIYEWEDVFADKLNLKFLEQNRFKIWILRYIFNSKTRLNSGMAIMRTNDDYVVSFIMNISDLKNFSFSRINLVPIFIDIWQNDIDCLLKIAHKFPIFFVTSLEVYNKLTQFISNVRFMPLSISDEWNKKIICSKDIDVVQMGRKNQKLHDYMFKIIKKHPGIEYVYQETCNKSYYYFSTKRGNLGEFNHRYECMKLLSRAKISLVSSPGADKSRDTGGINPVTPRFFESTVNYCHMLGSYLENEDFQYCNINDICKNILNFEDFETYLLEYLNSDFSSEKKNIYDMFLNKNVTSSRVDFVKEVLGSL